MEICEIKRDKKHLTKIVFPDREALIDTTVCEESGLKVGMEIDEEILSDLKYESDFKRAKSRALWYLDRMDYTEKALFEKLVRAGFSKKACAAVLAKLVELGLVNDERFAERFAERCAERNISKREAVQKMFQKGFPLELAKEKVNALETDEEDQIALLLEGKYANKLLADDGISKVYAALIRKGFSFSAVKSALSKYKEELEFCEE